MLRLSGTGVFALCNGYITCNTAVNVLQQTPHRVHLQAVPDSGRKPNTTVLTGPAMPYHVCDLELGDNAALETDAANLQTIRLRGASRLTLTRPLMLDHLDIQCTNVAYAELGSCTVQQLTVAANEFAHVTGFVACKVLHLRVGNAASVMGKVSRDAKVDRLSSHGCTVALSLAT